MKGRNHCFRTVYAFPFLPFSTQAAGDPDHRAGATGRDANPKAADGVMAGHRKIQEYTGMLTLKYPI